MLLGTSLARSIRPGWPAVLSGVSSRSAFLVQFFFHYYLAALLYLGAAIVAQRHGGNSLLRLLVIGLLSGAMFVAHVPDHLDGEIVAPGFGGAGWVSSIWPLLQLASYSPAASPCLRRCCRWQCGVRVCSYSGHSIANHGSFRARRLVTDLSSGDFAWYVPPRYVEGAVIPLLLVSFWV